MKKIALENASLESCVEDARRERIIVTRGGVPVALIVGLKGIDAEQTTLGGDAAFWELIAERRTQETIDRAELERRLGVVD